ncbi:MAG: acetyl-CoA carboxylase carboxyl transferase subunit alpha, partial [Devosiaceae bacterium]|nr:acetyl-CoA carboxylase carboxyl transferase subunit alpha [Devosiaceae bacterium]
QNSIYSVISPEAGAAILWRDAGKAQEAANTMKITAQDLSDFGIIDGIVNEPAGGAHRHIQLVIEAVGAQIEAFLDEFSSMSREEVVAHRRKKFLEIGKSLI